MRNGIDLVMVHDGRTDANGTRTFADLHFFKCAVGLFLEHRFAAVIGHIDKRRFEFHQRIQVVIDGIDRLSFQWGKYFKGNQGAFACWICSMTFISVCLMSEFICWIANLSQ